MTDLLYPPGTVLKITHGQTVELPEGLARPTYVLRDLPGVAGLVPHLNPRPWSPEEEQLQARVDAVSRALFGITEAETAYGVDPPLDEDEWQAWASAETTWENSLDLSDEEFPEVRAMFEIFGWDVTDGAGEEHPALVWLERQILCASRGRRGQLPGEIAAAPSPLAAEEWGGGLAASVEAWRSKRRGGR